MSMNTQVLLAARPAGEPKDSDFRIIETPVPEPGDGEMLLRALYLSLDPYMRGRMNAGPSYAASVGIGAVMTGRTVSEVIASNLAGYVPGDLVFSLGGWQSHSLSDGTGARKVDSDLAPITTALGVLGMPGLTAYVGLLDLGLPRAGESVVVSAATGAVGSLAAQIARIKGCRVVGIAGGPEKCAYATGEMRLDACIDHRDPEMPDRLAAACPDGIDVYFENVGGPVFEAVLPLLNPFSRIPLCGRIARYNAAAAEAGPDRLGDVMGTFLVKQVTLRGFIVGDHMHRFDAFQRDVAGWIGSGDVVYREDIVDGLASAPATFRGLLRGANFGKQLIRIAPDA